MCKYLCQSSWQLMCKSCVSFCWSMCLSICVSLYGSLSVTFNASKSSDLVITGSRRGSVHPRALTILGTVIPTAESVFHLGVFTSAHLQWNAHVRHLRNKVAATVGMLRRLRHPVSPFFIATIYTWIIRTTLENGTVFVRQKFNLQRTSNLQ